MSMQTITERELAENGVASLPLTPTASPALGGRDYTPNEVKAAFDRLPRLIAARLNALLGAVTDGTLLADIPVAFGDGTLSLSELLALLGDHLVNPPAPDSAPASESGNTVTSGGVYTALAALREDVQSAAKTATDSALRAQKLRYDAATGVLSLAAEEGSTAFDSASLPIPGMQETLALLRTLLGASVLSETVEDTFTARPTAGGLPAVDEAPTTVHTLSGATTTSRNIVDLAGAISSSTVHGVSVTANNNLVTFSGTADQTSWFSYSSFIDLDRYIGKTLTFSQSPFFTSSSAEGAAFWLLSVDGQARSTNANANGTLTVTLEPGHSYRASIRSGSGGAINQTISFMLNEGATALPYSDYYAGVKSAVLAGIVSTGRNLLAVTKSSTVTNGGLTYQADVSTGTVTITGTAGADGSASSLFDEFYLPRGVYTLYMPNKAAGYGIGWNIKTTKHQAIAAVSWNASKPYGAFTVEEAGKFYLLAYASSTAVDVHYTETPMILPGTVTEDFPLFEKYRADASFTPLSPVTLGKWDRIDVDAGKRIVGTVTETSGTPYTEEQLAQFDEYILSADGKTVTYRTAAVTETPLSLPKTYKAWHGGCEYIVKDAAGGQNGDDLAFTVTQDYYVRAGGESA